jgi:carboxymethylenebutenolidase
MRIALPSGTPAELALPETEPVRSLVVAPDIMGLRPLFDDLCRRLADQQRWAVCAPDPFPGRETLTIEQRQAAMAGLDDARQVGDLVAAADVLAARAGAPDASRVGVLGFCMGGMYTFKAAGTGRFDRAVSFYGMIRVPDGWLGPEQGSPLDALRRPEACPVLALLGGSDPYTPAADIEALQGLGERVTVVVYPDAQHGFVHDPARPTHRADDAADAWSRAAAFLA